MSFRDASPPSADLLGMPNGRSLVHSLTDDLTDNCSCSRAAGRQHSAAQSSGVNLLRGTGVWTGGLATHFMAAARGWFLAPALVCTHVFLFAYSSV